ncbi:hypothetical protein F4776DRAFT_342571 [Hypoxylon sp. NC0597]|nr:hypothetical protein F4776DRAFT_342571 [Hypoxylon sp. NC0597]
MLSLSQSLSLACESSSLGIYPRLWPVWFAYLTYYATIFAFLCDYALTILYPYEPSGLGNTHNNTLTYTCGFEVGIVNVIITYRYSMQSGFRFEHTEGHELHTIEPRPC